jgi:hypothetical protein
MPLSHKPQQLLFSTEFDFHVVRPGETSTAQGGFLANASANVRAQLSPELLASFQITKLETFDITDDPEIPVPKGFPVAKTLVLSRRVDGPGPIQADAGQPVLATLRFEAPFRGPLLPTPLSTFAGFVSMTGDGLPNPARLPVRAIVAEVRVDIPFNQIGIIQGGKAQTPVRATLVAGPDTTVTIYAGDLPLRSGHYMIKDHKAACRDSRKIAISSRTGSPSYGVKAPP